MTGRQGRADAQAGAGVARQPVQRRMEVIGHRGAPREAPENTTGSFQRAIELGADAIELDVHGSSDGTVFVHHDPVIGPRAHPAIANRAIAELTAAELERAHREDASSPPRLADILALAHGRAIAYVEVKGAGIERAVVSCIEASGTACAVHAFDHRAARLVHELAPALPTGILLESRLVDPVAALRGAGSRDYWQQWRMIDADLVGAVHAAAGRVIAWTVNDIAAAARLAALGVDGLCTDLPGVMRGVVDGAR